MLNHRPRDARSMFSQIEAAVAKHGPCSVDVIAPLLPAFTRSQIRTALGSLRSSGRLVLTSLGRHLGRGGGSTPAEYDIPGRTPGIERTPKITSEEPARPPRVASVWQLGDIA